MVREMVFIVLMYIVIFPVFPVSLI